VAGRHIGTLAERSLHAALKQWYAQPGDELEVPVSGYVVDIVRGDLLIEIQTGSFAGIKRKLDRLTRSHPVTLVYPVAAEKWIVKLGPDGHTRLDRRRSPQRGSVLALFRELVSLPRLVARDTLTIEVALVALEEVRVRDGRGSWRRGGWSIVDTRLLGVIDRVTLRGVEDYRALLPDNLPDPFTVADLAGALGERRSLAAKIAYCLREMGAITHIGKRGNAYLYCVSGAAPE
jgi:hypothetical protein